MESKIFCLFAQEEYLILGCVTFTTVPVQPQGWSFRGRTSLALHAQRHGTSYFHGRISLTVQTGAAGDADRSEITYGLVMSPQLAQGTGTHTTVLASWSCLWQSYLL